MATPNLSEMRSELRKLGCQLKSQLDGSWAIFERKGNRIIVATLDDVAAYVDKIHRQEQMQSRKPSVPKQERNNITEVRPLSAEEKSAMSTTKSPEKAERGPVTQVKPLSQEDLAALRQTPDTEIQESPPEEKKSRIPHRKPTVEVELNAGEDDDGNEKGSDAIFDTLKASAEKKVKLTAEQKFEQAAGSHCFKILRDERLQKGMNILQSEIKQNIMLAGCPSVLFDKVEAYVERRLQKECGNGTIVRREFKNHLGQEDIMFFDAQYAYLLVSD